MFHIRWQKLFNFSMCNKVMEDSMTNMLPVLTEIAKDTRRNHFYAKGKYKGVPVQSSNFIQDIKYFTPKLSDRAMFLLDYFQISRIKPILSGSYCQSDYGKNLNVNKMDHDSCSFSVFFVYRIQYLTISEGDQELTIM